MAGAAVVVGAAAVQRGLRRCVRVGGLDEATGGKVVGGGQQAGSLCACWGGGLPDEGVARWGWEGVVAAGSSVYMCQGGGSLVGLRYSGGGSVSGVGCWQQCGWGQQQCNGGCSHLC